jgi:AraC-like DNA-binding protein
MESLLTHSMPGVPENLQNSETLPSTALAPEVVSLLRQQLQSHLQYGYPPITLMADTLGMSVRSFQRLLEKNDLTYTLLVDQVRYEVAVRSLQNPTLNITEIAMNLGFSDSASFCHAFRRWNGLSPRQFRQRYARSRVEF